MPDARFHPHPPGKFGFPLTRRRARIAPEVAKADFLIHPDLDYQAGPRRSYFVQARSIGESEVRAALPALRVALGVPPEADGAASDRPLADERTIRDVCIRSKPFKFMLSSAPFAATMAWSIGLLPDGVRTGRTTRALAWTVIVSSLFEAGYITFQAAKGSASHFNISDPLHAALFGLMANSLVLTG